MPSTTRTTPSRVLAIALALAATAALPVTALAKHGADDGPGDDRGGVRQGQRDDSGSGRGSDDSGRDDNGGRRGGSDDDGGGSGGDRQRVSSAGRCTAGATAKLKAKHDDGRLEVEFEVDQNRSGVTWTVELRRDGTRVVNTRATTGGRSGSFSVERKIADGAGGDRIAAKATSPSGQVCTASVTV